MLNPFVQGQEDLRVIASWTIFILRFWWPTAGLSSQILVDKLGLCRLQITQSFEGPKWGDHRKLLIHPDDDWLHFLHKVNLCHNLALQGAAPKRHTKQLGCYCACGAACTWQT